VNAGRLLSGGEVSQALPQLAGRSNDSGQPMLEMRASGIRRVADVRQGPGLMLEQRARVPGGQFL
jgi:hypothetical protein